MKVASQPRVWPLVRRRCTNDATHLLLEQRGSDRRGTAVTAPRDHLVPRQVGHLGTFRGPPQRSRQIRSPTWASARPRGAGRVFPLGAAMNAVGRAFGPAVVATDLAAPRGGIGAGEGVDGVPICWRAGPRSCAALGHGVKAGGLRRQRGLSSLCQSLTGGVTWRSGHVRNGPKATAGRQSRDGQGRDIRAPPLPARSIFSKRSLTIIATPNPGGAAAGGSLTLSTKLTPSPRHGARRA